MDINHIELNYGQVAGLYSNLLVQGDPSAPLPAEEVPAKPVSAEPVSQRAVPVSNDTGYKSLGNNQQKVLVLVDYPHISFLPDDQLRFLTGILNACKLSMADVAILNLHHYPETDYKQLLAFFGSTKMLLFGQEPGRISLPLDFPAFQLQAFNGCSYHWSPSLNELENERQLKTKLWNNLKLLFQL